MRFCYCVLASFGTGGVEGFMEEGVGFVAVAIEWDVGVFVLEFVRATITVADVNADYHAMSGFGCWELSAVL